MSKRTSIIMYYLEGLYMAFISHSVVATHNVCLSFELMFIKEPSAYRSPNELQTFVIQPCEFHSVVAKHNVCLSFGAFPSDYQSSNELPMLVIQPCG